VTCLVEGGRDFVRRSHLDQLTSLNIRRLRRRRLSPRSRQRYDLRARTLGLDGPDPPGDDRRLPPLEHEDVPVEDGRVEAAAAAHVFERPVDRNADPVGVDLADDPADAAKRVAASERLVL
jgi:hypothetical protein